MLASVPRALMVPAAATCALVQEGWQPRIESFEGQAQVHAWSLFSCPSRRCQHTPSCSSTRSIALRRTRALRVDARPCHCLPSIVIRQQGRAAATHRTLDTLVIESASASHLCYNTRCRSRNTSWFSSLGRCRKGQSNDRCTSRSTRSTTSIRPY